MIFNVSGGVDPRWCWCCNAQQACWQRAIYSLCLPGLCSFHSFRCLQGWLPQLKWWALVLLPRKEASFESWSIWVTSEWTLECSTARMIWMHKDDFECTRMILNAQLLCTGWPTARKRLRLLRRRLVLDSFMKQQPGRQDMAHRMCDILVILSSSLRWVLDYQWLVHFKP